ncbi:MAG: hypothetical protein ACFFDI_21265 [Promethearchaeota archaeon]
MALVAFVAFAVGLIISLNLPLRASGAGYCCPEAGSICVFEDIVAYDYYYSEGPCNEPPQY